MIHPKVNEVLSEIGLYDSINLSKKGLYFMKIDKKAVGEKIYLRPLTEEDTQMVVSWRNSKRVMDNFIYRTPLTYESHLKWFREKVETGEVVDFIVCDKENDMPLGCVYLQHFEKENRKAEIGIFLGEDRAFGRGIGKEACRLMVKYGFEELKLHKIISRVLSFNEASVKTHEAAGFVKEALFKDDVFVEGKYLDVIFLGVINPEER